MDIPFEFECSKCKTVLEIKLSQIKSKRSHKCHACGFTHDIAPDDIDKAIREIKEFEENLKKPG